MNNLEEKEKMLVVVDMVNGFVKGGALADPYIATIIPEVIKWIGKTKNERGIITFANDTHEVNSEEFKSYPLHCIKGTWEAKVVDELIPYTKEATIYEKDFVNTFRLKQFRDDIQRMKNLREVIVTGCCTDICVKELVTSLLEYINKNNRNIEVIIPENAVTTFEIPGHNREECHEKGIITMEKSGARILRRK